MVKIEGINRIAIDTLCEDLVARFGFKSKRAALTALCEALLYNVVDDAIYTQVEYLLENDMFSCDKSTLIKAID